jgi:hypothetical protein
MPKLADAMEARISSHIAERKARPTQKLRKEQRAPAPSTPQSAAKTATQSNCGNPKVRSYLEKGISELQGLHELLLSNEVDTDVLADFRDALSRVRNTAWAAQQ